MAKNKYAKDYAATEYTDSKGKTRKGYAYVGKKYHYTDPLKAEAAKKPLAAALAAGWVSCVGAMVPNSGAMHALYIALPFAACLVPLMVVTDAAFYAMRGKDPFETRYFDKLNNNFPAACAILCMFVIFSLIGELTVLFGGKGRMPADLWFLLGAGVLLFAAGYMFSLRKAFLMQPEAEDTHS